MIKITIETKKIFNVKVETENYKSEHSFKQGEHLKNHITRRTIKELHILHDEDLKGIDATLGHEHPTVNGEKVNW